MPCQPSLYSIPSVFLSRCRVLSVAVTLEMLILTSLLTLLSGGAWILQQ